VGVPQFGALTGLHVLVVEDDDDARDILRSVLTYLGAFVSTAATAHIAVNILGHIKADVVVCDVYLGDTDALWLIREARAHQPGTPFIAVSAQEQGLLPISQHALKFYGHISYHAYEGFALDLGERERLVADLGQKNKSMILRNHGLLVCGRSIPEAFVEVYSLERACQGQIASLSGGSRLIIPPAEVCERTASQYNSDAAARQAHAKKAWSSALRLIDGGFAQ